MPLIKSGSREAISTNIREMQAAGHPHDQAVAAALSNARRYGRGRAEGGSVRSSTLVVKDDGRSAKSDMLPKPHQDRLGGADLPTSPVGTNARAFWQTRDERAAGGGVQPPFGTRMAARSLMREGFLHSAVPGRTDKLPITVGGGSYVLPADHVAALGQGNSLSGSHIVNKMFKMGPYGTAMGGLRQARPTIPHLGRLTKAHGGKTHDHGQPTEIVAAGGEIVIPPHAIIAKFGDLAKGHRALDQWVLNTRKKHIKTLKKLPGPAQ